MTDFPRPNADKSPNDGEKNALAPVDESAVQTNVDADDETRATKEDDVPFYNDNWFDEDEKETFGQKLKRLLSLFAWSACLTRQDFVAAFGVAFVAVALSILSLSASFATHLADGLQFSFVVLGGLGFLVVHVAGEQLFSRRLRARLGSSAVASKIPFDGAPAFYALVRLGRRVILGVLYRRLRL